MDKLQGVKVTLPENFDLIVSGSFFDLQHIYGLILYHFTRYTEQQDFVKEYRNIKNFPNHQRTCPNLFLPLLWSLP